MLLKILPLVWFFFLEWGRKDKSPLVQECGNGGGGITSVRKGEIGKVLSVDSVENEDYDVNCSKYPGQASS